MSLSLTGFHHVALTGAPGVGKTTLVRSLIEQLESKGFSCHGFYTEEVRSNGKRIGFDVVTTQGQKTALARIKGSSNEPQSHSRCCVGQYVVNVLPFENLALPAISAKLPLTSVLIIDEIGKMELFSSAFINKIRKLLHNCTNPILMTIPIPRESENSILTEIRSHNKIKVVKVDKLNRNDPSLHEDLLKLLTRQNM